MLEGNKNFKLSKTDITKPFSIATSQAHFLFDGKVYDQTDGVAMGSPLAPVVAIYFWDIMKTYGLIALFENDVTKFCTYACWDTNADKDYIVTLIIVPLLREET